MNFSLWAFIFTATSVVSGFAQNSSVAPANVPLRTVVPTAGTNAVDPPEYDLSLKWDDRGDGSITTVQFTNTSDQPMRILGVQATRGIFVGDFSTKIGAGKSDTISFIYSAVDNTDGDTDVIRLLTDQGIKDVRIRTVRDKVFSFDTRELHWTVGDAANAKLVTLTVATGPVIPKNVVATGGNKAELVAVNSSTWQVKVTPATTAKSGQFAVTVTFDKSLPGAAAVILGVIQAKE